MRVLKCGNCEPLKTAVHGAVLGLAALCGLYNAAAWLSRREAHLGVNAVLYAALIAWEREHVRHHLRAQQAWTTGRSSIRAALRTAA